MNINIILIGVKFRKENIFQINSLKKQIRCYHCDWSLNSKIALSQFSNYKAKMNIYSLMCVCVRLRFILFSFELRQRSYDERNQKRNIYFIIKKSKYIFLLNKKYLFSKLFFYSCFILMSKPYRIICFLKPQFYWN